MREASEVIKKNKKETSRKRVRYIYIIYRCMCQARECGRAESGSEALRMYVHKNRDASTKYDLPVHVLLRYERDRSRDDDDYYWRKHHYMRENLLSYYENKDITKW